MNRVLNACAYRFVPLADPSALRGWVHALAAAAALKGSVLLADEGINLCVAGNAFGVRGFLDQLRREDRFAGLAAQESWSDSVPFRHLHVKVKREIIRMDTPTVRPGLQRAPAVTPATLERWLDSGVDDCGRPLALLDVRNAFEIERGALHGAIDWRLGRFGEFPGALAAHADDLAGKTVVVYCTGGIRCEKAAVLMQQAGLGRVYQLDGGILGYLQHTAARHWNGECVVFDARGALDASLTPSIAPDAPGAAAG